MSYSRWSNSSWYTFWDAGNSGETLVSQELAVWYDLDHMFGWKYPELQEFLAKEHSYAVRLLELKYGCSPDEASEVLEYMQDFCIDVKQQFA